ncbi:VF530 family protein [Mucilaginibacter sp.]|uniref:VF530 family protein n=1 Tax=Mucilaginibacter sp. TaxID=1882438 RepID=UPI0026076E5B|nr:VF530 family protein [Mucilaginibacter sp.]MDB5032271.1 hypothetical protein [Mucilaginibacter sp.]
MDFWFQYYEPSTINHEPMEQPNNKLHGITLETILNELVAKYGWPELGYRIRINCFLEDPSIKSSLKFLRKTDWARKKVEELYLKGK